MKGLIIKDFLIFKQQAKVYALIIIVWLFMSFMQKDTMILCGMLSLTSVFITITVIAYDEKAGWEKFALTMPISRNNMIISRYVFTLGIALIANIFGLIINFIVIKDVDNSLISFLFFMAISFLGSSILLPLIIKFGTEKGRMLIFALVFIPTFLIAGAEKLGIRLPVIKSLTTFSILVFITTVVLILISIFISIKIYNKKEL